MPNIGPLELVIILAILLLLFGGARLAGLGKSTGRALREFKEETKDLKGKDGEEPHALDNQQAAAPQQPQPYVQQPQQPYVQQQPYPQQPPTGNWQQPSTGNVQDPAPEVRRDS